MTGGLKYKFFGFLNLPMQKPWQKKCFLEREAFGSV